jgi:CDP-paratose 2-epimerase
MARAGREGRRYRIFGHRRKQVRDNLHSADVCGAIMAFAERPSSGAVYNLGGGRANSVSLLEALARFEELLGAEIATEYLDEARRGDHVCYITDLSRFRADHPGWEITVPLDQIFEQLAGIRVGELVT